jgi:hypothetical protein
MQSFAYRYNSEKGGMRTRWLLWSVWFVSSIWLNQTNQINQTN